jgi:hypothetical protein
MARARKGTSTQTKLGFLIYGEQGTWKSSMCLEFAKYKREDGKPFKVLYIDIESGSIDDYIDGLAEQGVNPDNLYIVYTQSLGEVREYIKRATLNEDFYELDENGDETDIVVTDADGKPFRADAIVVDGTSVLYIATQQGLVEFSQKRALVRAKKKELTGMEKVVATTEVGLELNDWNKLVFKGQDFILDLNASGKHWAITARETDEKERVEVVDQNGQKSFTSVATGRKIPEGFKNMGYNAKTVLHMSMDESGSVQAIVQNKDRSMVHSQNELIENPSLMDWAVVIERNKNRKEFVLANGLGESVKKEQQIYEKEIMSLDTDAPPFDVDEKKSEGDKTVEKLQVDIVAVIAKMDANKKKTLKSQLTKAGLPVKYSEVTDANVLEKILAIISK